MKELKKLRSVSKELAAAQPYDSGPHADCVKRTVSSNVVDANSDRVCCSEELYKTAEEDDGVRGKHHDLVNHTKKYKGDLYEFYLDLKSWRLFKTRHNLSWQKLRFSNTNHASIPKQRGIYAFTVELAPSKLPMHGYILYVGITGDTSNANLYKRYAQYLRQLKNEDGRPRVFMFLKTWEDDLFFNFVPVPNVSVDLAKLEKDMLNALKPPVNFTDFDADIISVRAANF